MVREIDTLEWFNIADVGYGFSQVLPVIAQLHALQTPKRKNASYVPLMRKRPSLRFFACEQPELHLHPAFQASLADVFEAAIYTGDARNDDRVFSGINIVAETHSEALINRLAELVDMGNVSKEDVAIYIFEKEDNASPTKIKLAEFDNSGSIKNWPIGFFNYSNH